MQCFQKSILFFKIAPYHIDWFSKKFHSNKVWQQFFVFVLQTSSEVVWILWNGTHDIALSQHLTFDNYSTHNFLFLAVRVFDWPIIPETENELFVNIYIEATYKSVDDSNILSCINYSKCHIHCDLIIQSAMNWIYLSMITQMCPSLQQGTGCLAPGRGAPVARLTSTFLYLRSYDHFFCLRHNHRHSYLRNG